ncbi:MAG TPA: GIDE domain-containing protein [Candidatus Eisenbacteria bacterium]|jgi:hypothetical protein|nr:GIDE domain-containing protein [Candidatus Eisenbacteria bacterium]
MSDERLFAYLLAGLFGGVALFVYGFVLRQRRKTIESIPTSKVRSMAMGLVELSGKAAPAGATFPSPFACAECVYYRYHVEERVSSGRREYWRTLARGESPGPFCLEDETGRVLVRPGGADLNLDVDRQYSTGLLGENSAEFGAGLERLGIGRAAWGFSRTLRCSETYISPGDPIFVLGTASQDPSKAMTARGDDCLMISSGGSGAYFCISDKSEKDLLASFALKMYACLYGGPALTVGCLYLLIERYWRT